MHLPKALLIAILLPFSFVTLYALSQVGYVGIFLAHNHPAGYQVLFDLVIACLLCMTWIIRDAKAQGRNPWPFVLLTLTLGSFGPLLYLLLSKPEQRA
jgi:hypothetical protein